MGLTLEIVTPRGVAFSATGLDRVVMRRAESQFELGSELVVMPRHGELMVRLPFHVLRARSGNEITHIEVDGGFAEAYNDTITILTRDARVVAQDAPECAPAS